MTTASPTALLELQAWPHWVCWRTQERNGKPTKVPVQPNGRPASSTDPKTWSTYQRAADACLDNNRFDGVGYVFAPDDEYTGIDLDKCVTPAPTDPFSVMAGLDKNGPVIHGSALEIVNRLASYTELSPTGTGLHTIVRGRVNGSRNRTSKTPWGGEFEHYDQGRFFTITGRHLAGTPTTIEARQDVLDQLSAELFAPSEPPRVNGKGNPRFLANGAAVFTTDTQDVLEKIRSSKQAKRFAELYDTGAPEGQESESDLALCNILAFWLGPQPYLIDSVFRGSALMRDKWDEKRGDTTYGGYTINRALEGRTEFYGQKTSTPARKHDDPEMPYSEEISRLFGIIDDPVVSGWRSKRGANSRVVFVTRSGATLDIESWKTATASARALNQEIALQLGVEGGVGKDDMSRLNVLVGKFCTLTETMSIDQRARELGERFLEDAEEHHLDWANQDERWNAFQIMRARHPAAKAKVDGTSIAAESLVLVDKHTGHRYVRVQWFIDFVKANVVAGTAGAVAEAIEKPGWWARPNTQGRFKAAHPGGGKPSYAVMYEVPAGWEGE